MSERLCHLCGQLIVPLTPHEAGELRARRRRLQVRKKVLAWRLGVSKVSLWRWETGISQPTIKHRRAWRQALGLEPAERPRAGDQ